MPKELPGKTDNKRNLRAGEIQKNLYFPRFLYMGNTGQKEKEGELILKALQPGDVVVLLDEGGKEMRSIEFADYMKRKMNTVNKRLVFIIGGPYGFSPKVYEAAHEKMSLSRMTFSHQMVRLIFVEQLYRAMNILNGGPYHHE